MPLRDVLSLGLGTQRNCPLRALLVPGLAALISFCLAASLRSQDPPAGSDRGGESTEAAQPPAPVPAAELEPPSELDARLLEELSRRLDTEVRRLALQAGTHEHKRRTEWRDVVARCRAALDLEKQLGERLKGLEESKTKQDDAMIVPEPPASPPKAGAGSTDLAAAEALSRQASSALESATAKAKDLKYEMNALPGRIESLRKALAKEDSRVERDLSATDSGDEGSLGIAYRRLSQLAYRKELELRQRELEVVRLELGAAKARVDSFETRASSASRALLKARQADALRLEEEAKGARAKAEQLKQEADRAQETEQERLLADSLAADIDSLVKNARAASGRFKARGEEIAERLRREKSEYALFREALLSRQTHTHHRRELVLGERRRAAALKVLVAEAEMSWRNDAAEANALIEGLVEAMEGMEAARAEAPLIDPRAGDAAAGAGSPRQDPANDRTAAIQADARAAREDLLEALELAKMQVSELGGHAQERSDFYLLEGLWVRDDPLYSPRTLGRVAVHAQGIVTRLVPVSRQTTGSLFTKASAGSFKSPWVLAVLAASVIGTSTLLWLGRWRKWVRTLTPVWLAGCGAMLLFLPEVPQGWRSGPGEALVLALAACAFAGVVGAVLRATEILSAPVRDRLIAATRRTSIIVAVLAGLSLLAAPVARGEPGLPDAALTLCGILMLFVLRPLLLGRRALWLLLANTNPVAGQVLRVGSWLLLLLATFLLGTYVAGYRGLAGYVAARSGVALAAILGCLFLVRWLQVRIRASIETSSDAKEESAEEKLAAVSFLGTLATRAVGLAGLLVGAWVMLNIFGVSLSTLWSLLNVPLHTPLRGEPFTWGNIVAAVLTFVVCYVAVVVVNGLLSYFLLPAWGLPGASHYTILLLVRWFLFAVAVVVALHQVHLSLGDLQWLLAAAGVGIGFGLQEIFGNFFSGLILLFERPIKVGDVVSVGESRGTVHRINFRSTELRMLDNRFLIVPNKEFITSKVMNWTGADPKVRADIEVSVAYGSDVALVKKVMLDVAERDGRVRKRPLPDVLLKAFGESSIDFTLRVWLNRPDDIPTVSSDLRFALHAAFERAGIQMPFPQRDIHLRSAEPLMVRVEGAMDARGELSPVGEPTGGGRE